MPTGSDDIVTRLRGAGSWLITGEWAHDPLCRDAAKAIEARDAEIERLRGLMKAFVYQWEQEEIGKGNGTEYFNAVHAMRMAVRGE